MRSQTATVTLALSLFFCSLTGTASEIDSFLPRYEHFSDGLNFISQETDHRITHAVESANRISSCSSFALEAYLAIELMRPMYGQIEHFLNTTPSVPKYRVHFVDSVYNQLPPINYFLNYMGEIFVGFGVVVRDGNLLIGADKFGHFIDEGFWLYTRLKPDESNIDDVLTSNENSENGLNGLLVGGVKSYGDLNANYNGMLFWKDMLSLDGRGKNPFVKCENEKWVKIRTFDYEDYVNAGWDEGINCSSFQTEEFEHAVLTSIENLQKKTRKQMVCPIFPDECVKLAKRYGPYARKLLHPKCLAAAESSKTE